MVAFAIDCWIGSWIFCWEMDALSKVVGDHTLNPPSYRSEDKEEFCCMQ